jgi:CheY-like chemotaxis protein
VTGARILLLEDEPSAREGLGLLLEDSGYEVTAVSDGQKAIDLLAFGFDVDLLIVDLRTPRVSGDDVLRYVQSDPQLRNVPVIVTTAVARDQVKVAADVIFEKPLDITAFLDEIRRLTDAHGPEHSARVRPSRRSRDADRDDPT